MFDKTVESRIALSDLDRRRAPFLAVVSGGVLHEIDSKHGPLKTKGPATRKFNPPQKLAHPPDFDFSGVACGPKHCSGHRLKQPLQIDSPRVSDFNSSLEQKRS